MESFDSKDTEALVGDLQVPEVYSQVIRGHERFVVTVDGDGVDVICMGIGEDPSGRSLHHQVHGLQNRNLIEASNENYKTLHCPPSPQCN